MSSLSSSEMLFRVVMAFLAGLLIGWERETHGRPAGLRTNILACVAASLAMIVSEVLFLQSAATTPSGSWRPDPARLGAGILTGIGFLGAGTILRHANLIRGVTTAASLWFVTVLGLVFGTGQIVLGLLGLGLALITLHGLPRLERHIDSDWYATLSVVASMDALGEDELRQRITGFGANVQAMKLTYDLEKKQKTLSCDLKLKKRSVLEVSRSLVNDLKQCHGVIQVRWF